MGSAMETFCCANKVEINNNQDNHNPNDIINPPTQRNLPSTEIFTGTDLNKILQINSNDINDKPFSNYELVDRLGKGGCGEVFIIKNKNDKNIFALKKLKRNKSLILSEDEIKQELELLKNLNHSYINKIYEYYISDDYIFIIEEFCSEGSLKDKLDKIIIFPEFIVKIIMFQMFKALLYLGSKNIVHGNLKLENILLELNVIEKEKKVYKKIINFDEDKFFKAIYNDIEIINNSLGHKGANYKIDLKQMDSIKIFNKKINDSQKRVESSQVSTNMRFGSLKNVDEKLRAIPNLKYTGSNNIYNSGKFESLKFGIKINDFNCSKLLERNKTNLNNIIYSSPEALSNNEIKIIVIYGIVE
jgi:serine/threonine protein kinase